MQSMWNILTIAVYCMVSLEVALIVYLLKWRNGETEIQRYLRQKGK